MQQEAYIASCSGCCCVRYCSSTDGVYHIRYISTVVFGSLVKAVGPLKKYCNKVLKSHLKSLANINEYYYSVKLMALKIIVKYF